MGSFQLQIIHLAAAQILTSLMRNGRTRSLHRDPDLVDYLGDGLCGLHVSCKKLRLGNLNPHSKSLCSKTFP